MSFDVVTFVNQQVGLFTGAATDQSVTWAKESQFAIQAFQKNDFLAKTAMATLPAHRMPSSMWQPLA